MKTLSLARLSVYVDQDVHSIYGNLTSKSVKKAEDFPFETMKDLFITSACIGAKYDRYIELKRGREILMRLF